MKDFLLKYKKAKLPVSKVIEQNLAKFVAL